MTALDFRFQDIRSLSNSGSSQGSNPSDPSINRTERTSNDFEVKTLNYYVTGTVDWKDKLIVDGLVRWDGSSLFGPNNRWNTFYRTSLAYRLTQDVEIPGIDELKFRASYGTAGNRPQFGYRFETLNADGTKNTLGNEDLKSSLQREIEVGLDTRLWDRLNASVSYSRSVRSDLFHELPLAGALANPADWEAIISKQFSVIWHSTQIWLPADVTAGMADVVISSWANGGIIRLTDPYRAQ